MLATGGGGSLVLDTEREQMWLEQKRLREMSRELKEKPIL